jgi:hypothetical protein
MAHKIKPEYIEGPKAKKEIRARHDYAIPGKESSEKAKKGPMGTDGKFPCF